MKNGFRQRLYQMLRQWLAGPERSLQEQYPEYDIGKGSYGDLQVIGKGKMSTLSIGKYTSIAAGVKVFLTYEHRTDWVTTYPFNVFWATAQHIQGHPSSKGDVIIGNDVWIATEAMIMSGVQIGDGAVIGARAVVSKNVPPYAVVVGNPSRIVKYRFDEQIITRLLVVKWWDWEESRIERAMALLLSNRITDFLSEAEAGRI